MKVTLLLHNLIKPRLKVFYNYYSTRFEYSVLRKFYTALAKDVPIKLPRIRIK